MASLRSKNLDEIFDNLTIINFNYDRCIEHYLFHVMHRLYPSKGEGHLTGLLNQKLKILHPYGLVGNLPWQSRTNFVQFGGGAGNNLAALSNQIRTYNEEVDDKQKIADIRGALAEAQRIMFLGFHFHKQNVELLSPAARDPRLSGKVAVYATQGNRSYADLEIIQDRRLPLILHGRTTLTGSSVTDLQGCKELFRDFGGMLSG